LRGFVYWDFLREKENAFSSILDPKDINILSLGPSGTLGKEEDSPELISDYGAQKACL
jgi:hypothetical protein